MAHAEKKTLVIPGSSDIMKALECADPTKAQRELQDKMEFFLNVVFPAIDPKMARADLWLARDCNHIQWFGQQRWPVEMAMGMILLDSFSDTGNIEHNAGITEEGQERKRRKKMQTDELTQKLETQILDYKEKCCKLLLKPGFVDKMKEWDKLCCKKREREANDTAPKLANHVPPMKFELGPIDSIHEGSFMAVCLAAAAPPPDGATQLAAI